MMADMADEALSPESRRERLRPLPHRRIEDYGLIGNMHSAADRARRLDRLAGLPRFDRRPALPR